MDVFLLKKILSLLVQIIPAVPVFMLLFCLVYYRRGAKTTDNGLSGAAGRVISGDQ